MRLILVLALGCSGEQSEDVVKTDKGEVQGLLDRGVRRFLGVPFAAPPVGDLRFEAPMPHAAWARMATRDFGNACRQPLSPITEYMYFDEDCLYLNVYTPRPAPAHAPVMVWLHGGAFIIGSGAEPMYEASALARRGVIVVTVNYRMGPLGFLAYAGTSGNQGIEDQRAALKWVQTNIAAFGGDPQNVTLFGESAGAISVYIHLADAASGGLFKRVIVESGFTHGAGILPLPTKDQASAQGMQLAAAVGCGDLACLRTKDPSALGKALMTRPLTLGGMGVLWWPISSPLAAIESGSFNKVPVILGTNGDEGTLLQFLGKAPASDADYVAQVQAQFGADSAAVLAQYPVSKYATPSAAAAAVMGDAIFVSDARRTARALVAAGVPVWRYSFERVPVFQPIPDLGAYHAAEIRFVFDSTFLGNALTADEEVLGGMMRDHWVGFARDGKPGSKWPAYDAATDSYLEFNAAATAKTGLKSAVSDFWDGLNL
jgi:para-nitrobenzyl esterase